MTPTTVWVFPYPGKNIGEALGMGVRVRESFYFSFTWHLFACTVVCPGFEVDQPVSQVALGQANPPLPRDIAGTIH